MPAVKQQSMKMAEVREKAKTLGITPGKMKKTELIHSIQKTEGHSPCFGQASDQCEQTNCCFMGDCFKAK